MRLAFRTCRVSAALLISLIAGGTQAAQLEFDEYLQRAEAARTRGDWESVANQFAQAINHPDLPKDSTTRSMVNREYGRALGVICQYGEAEKFLLRAKDFPHPSYADRFLVLYELGSLNAAQKKYADAATYFAQSMSLIELAKVAPALMADAYEKYALVLAETGKADEAAARRGDADRIREMKLKPAPPGTITPYGAQCPR